MFYFYLQAVEVEENNEQAIKFHLSFFGAAKLEQSESQKRWKISSKIIEKIFGAFINSLA